MTAAPIHLQPTATLAERVLLPGDPGRALRLAQQLIDSPLMFNHNRGLWGYTGTAKDDGAPLTIQSTGIGGPSAAIVIHELIDLGARRLLRIGTCGGLDPALGLGQLLVASEVIATDGTSRALGAGERVAPSPGLLRRLRDLSGAPVGDIEPPVNVTATDIQPGGGRGPIPATSAGAATPGVGPVVTTDLFYDDDHLHAGWVAAGARAVEMEAATLLTLAARREVEAAVLLTVSDRLGPVPERISQDALLAAEGRMGALALSALDVQSLQQSQPT